MSSSKLRHLFGLATIAFLGSTAASQSTARVSVDSSQAQANAQSTEPSISDDGRIVAFASDATNLVPGDTNGMTDVFVRVLETGATSRVSLDSGENQVFSPSHQPALSAGGRYVAFTSHSAILVPGDTNAVADVFVRDRLLGTTERISVDSAGNQSDALSALPSISGDGRYVAFQSLATNLVAGDTNGLADIFVRDRQAGTTERVSVSTGGGQATSGSENSSISADGRYVVFQSLASNLVAGDTNGAFDVFLRDRQLLSTIRVSLGAGGAEANAGCDFGSISADGNFVTFRSTATNLVAGDTNSVRDIFVRDLVGATTERVSVDSGGLQANGPSLSTSISGAGRFVAFVCQASNLVASDTNLSDDVFVRDRQSGTTVRVSVDTAGTEGNAQCLSQVSNARIITGDGRLVVFDSLATNLVPGDTNATWDVFARERGGGTEQQSSGTNGAPSNGASSDTSISADDRFVAFESIASNLVPVDANGFRDVFVRDRVTGTTTLVSVDTGGIQGNGDSSNPSITADGRYVTFESLANNLVAGDTNAVADVFVRDRQAGTTIRASVTTAGGQGNGASTNPAFAFSGSAVAFESASTNLVGGDTNGVADVFVRDLQAITTTRESVSSGGAQGNGASGNASISSSGALVAFESAATNLVGGDSNLSVDVFVRDRTAVATTRVSVDSSGTQGLGASTDPSISGDGRFVAFASAANNLVGGDINATVDVFVRDRQIVSTKRVSQASDGSEGLMWSGDPSISADGRHIAFASDSNNLVAGDANATMDVFVHDQLFATTERVSVDSSGDEGTGASSNPSITADGRHVAFESVAPNLVIGDTNGFSDAFVRDHGIASAFEEFCPGDGTIAPCPCGNSGTSGRGCQNSGATGGALLTVRGVASLSADTVQFTSSGERPTSLSIFLQGSTPIAPINYGDGIRCTGGTLKRLFTKTAVGGVVTAPQAGDISVSARSAQLNATIPLGATRPYQVYYRDGAPAFCPDPPGSTFNVSNGFLVAWGG